MKKVSYLSSASDIKSDSTFYPNYNILPSTEKLPVGVQRKTVSSVLIKHLVERSTDKNHPLSVKQILNELKYEPYAISISEKTLLADLKMLSGYYPEIVFGNSAVYFDDSLLRESSDMPFAA